MEEIGNNNPADTGSIPSESFANIPAPTVEVKVRTMRSDLASLAASGGGLPRFDRVNVEGLSVSQSAAGVSGPKRNGSPIVVFLIVLLALAVVAVVGWFGYNAFLNKGSIGASGVQSGVPQAVPSTTASPIQTYVPPAAPPAPLIHSSLFKKPIDPTITFSFPKGGAAQTANDLLTYDQQVLGVLSAVDKKANFVEIDVKGPGGGDLGVKELFSAADAEIIDPNFLSAHFNPDATFFAYRDANGFWPGYVIALLPGENPLSLKNGIQTAIESSTKTGNVFLTGTAPASPSGFTDAVAGSTTVRALNFTGIKPAFFVYGWFQRYLVISTSRNGFIEALARLQ